MQPLYGPEKFPGVLKYIRETSRVWEQNKRLSKDNVQLSNPKIILVLKPVLKVQLKDPIPEF